MSSRASTTTQSTTPPSSQHGLSLTGLPENFLQASIDQFTLDITLLSLLWSCAPRPHISFPLAVQSSPPLVIYWSWFSRHKLIPVKINLLKSV
ncbi:hypothetical protein AMECASPLE_003986 [Ameca splendens]|uniref:Uncharacterized protein n=1 Tax=Ameca splendens TaxID=208324 RepID=A0ABV0XZ42_9TELE